MSQTESGPTEIVEESSELPSVISQSKQRWISAGILAVAVGFLVLAAVYDGGDTTGSPRASNLGASASDTTLGPTAGAVQPATAIIEGVLPQGGEASACSEPVGVDLAGGYGARLTINGIEVAPEEMNVNLDSSGAITNVMTPTRTLGHFTFRSHRRMPERPLVTTTQQCA